MFETLKEWLRVKLNPSQASIAAASGIATPENILGYQNAYEKVSVINRCIEILVNALAEIPFVCESDTVDKLLNQSPNPFQNRSHFIRNVLLDYFLDGNSFIYLDKTNKKLYHLPANSVTIVPNAKTFITRYDFNTSVDVWGKPNANAISYVPEEIAHIKTDNVRDIYRGSPRLESLDALIKCYDAMNKFMTQYFQNNAFPGVILETNNVLGKKIKDRLLAEWREAYSLLRKSAFAPVILDGAIKANPFDTKTFEEMAFNESKVALETQMAQSLGVPPALLAGNADKQTLTTFYLMTVLPIACKYGDAFTHLLNEKVYPDRESVAALREDIRSEALYYSTLVNSGIYSPDEARIGLRYEPLGGDNAKIRVPQNIAGSAVRPDTGGRPTNEDTGQTLSIVNNVRFPENETPTPTPTVPEITDREKDIRNWRKYYRDLAARKKT